ncbi:early boundary activity protein 3 [Drosophila nasuta]|uniref:early boundary activity protein 3 n=1 Tax=Drosophila nasuta TaxID=42062 RepID=UPI00295E3DC2|nr:early boundary activity protein 3 [Drosophila nasuta]
MSNNENNQPKAARISTISKTSPTRLSWFLAEIDEGVADNGKANGKKRLCVLHSMELLEADVSDKYMTRFVEFRLNGKRLEAKLILASDDRKVVDAALESMSKEPRDEEDDGRQMLIQYHEEHGNTRRLFQKVISPVHVVWMSVNPEIGGTPLIKLSDRCIAHVLNAYEKRDYMEKMLLHVKAACFDHAFDEPLEDRPQAPMDENSWMLVQYSPEPEIVIYQVVPYSQTVWREENLFKDVIAYLRLPGSEVILQAVVICYSQDEQAMHKKYDQLASYALEIDFPKPDDMDYDLLENKGTAALFARTSTTLFQRAEQRDSTGAHRRARRHLEELTENAENEAQMIIDAFEKVDSVRMQQQERLDNGPSTSSPRI